jgi:hypothetical protein
MKKLLFICLICLFILPSFAKKNKVSAEFFFFEFPPEYTTYRKVATWAVENDNIIQRQAKRDQYIYSMRANNFVLIRIMFSQPVKGFVKVEMGRKIPDQKEIDYRLLNAYKVSLPSTTMNIILRWRFVGNFIMSIELPEGIFIKIPINVLPKTTERI